MANYNEGDLVVFRTTDFEKNKKNQVGMITYKRTQKGNTTYDLRSEKGSAYTWTGVDEKKSNQTIDSNLTEVWLKNKNNNSMLYNKNIGHTRANFSKNVKLRIDGQFDASNILRVGHYERYNNFIFPPQGPRSF